MGQETPWGYNIYGVSIFYWYKRFLEIWHWYEETNSLDLWSFMYKMNVKS